MTYPLTPRRPRILLRHELRSQLDEIAARAAQREPEARLLTRHDLRDPADPFAPVDDMLRTWKIE